MRELACGLICTTPDLMATLASKGTHRCGLQACRRCSSLQIPAAVTCKRCIFERLLHGCKLAAAAVQISSGALSAVALIQILLVYKIV